MGTAWCQRKIKSINFIEGIWPCTSFQEEWAFFIWYLNLKSTHDWLLFFSLHSPTDLPHQPCIFPPSWGALELGFERTSARTRGRNAAFLQPQPLVGEPRDCSLGRTSPSRDPPFSEVTPYKEVESWGRLWQVGTGRSKAGQLLKAVWSSLNAWSEQFSHRQKVLLVSLLQFQDPGHLFFCNLISTQSTQITSIDVVSAGNMQLREESLQSKANLAKYINVSGGGETSKEITCVNMYIKI